MKLAKVFSTVALSLVFSAGIAGSAQADSIAAHGHLLVSGAPYPDFFEGVAIPANGPVETDEIVSEGPSYRIAVERRGVIQGELSMQQLAEILPEAFTGMPIEIVESMTSFAEGEAAQETN